MQVHAQVRHSAAQVRRRCGAVRRRGCARLAGLSGGQARTRRARAHSYELCEARSKYGHCKHGNSKYGHIVSE